MDFFTRTLRMTGEQSADVTTELALMGKEMGLTSSQIINDFQAVSADLAVYGKGAIDVFKDLEAQAKATGMQISSLVNVAKQFDTFDSAADKTAQLNAVLGTQLSSLEMMNMQYDERVNYLRQEVSFAVGNLDGLDQYTQQFVAQALGVGSVAEAQKMLNMSQSEYLKYQGDMAAANKNQEDLAKLTEELVPIMQSLKIAFMKIATSLSFIIVPLAAVLGFLGEYPLILQTLVAAFVAYNVVQKASNALNATAFFFQKRQMALRGSQIVLTEAHTAAIAGLGVVKKLDIIKTGLMTAAQKAFNFALFTTQGRLMLIFGVFMLLYSLFGQKINPPFIAAFAFMAVGVIALAFALKFVKGQAMLAAIVLALLAGAVALVFYGVAAMATALDSLITTLVESSTGLFTAGAGLYHIAGGILAIAGAMIMLGPLGVLGLIAMASTLAIMGMGLEKVSNGLEKISKLSTAMAGLGDNGLIAISSEGNKINAVMGTGDVMNNFSAGKMEVEVKMPKMETPKIELKVELMGRQLEAFVKEVVNR